MDINNSNIDNKNKYFPLSNGPETNILNKPITVKYTGISHGSISVRPSKSIKIKSLVPKVISIKPSCKKYLVK